MRDGERRILRHHPVQHFGNALFVAAALGLDRDAVHRRREFERLHVDVVFLVRIVQHAIEFDLLHLGDGADIARHEFIDLKVILALQLVQVANLERSLAVADIELRILAHSALMDAEDTNLAHVGVGDDLEYVRQHMFAGIGLGMKGLGIRIAKLALVERRCVTLGRIGRQGRQDVHQLVDTGAGPGRDEQDRHQMPFAQCLLERRMQLARRRLGAILEIAGQQVFIFLDQLVDQLAMGMRHVVEIRVTRVVLQNLDHVDAIMGRQVEQFALVAEALANVGDQARQVEIVDVDFVDDDHARQIALLGPAHHPFGHQLDAGLCVYHY